MKPIRAPNKTSLKLWGKITEKHKESIWLAKSLCKCIFQVIANLGQRKGTSFLQLLDLLPTCGYEYYWKFTSKHWSKSFLKVFIEYFRRWFVKSGSQICWWYVLGVRFVGWPKKLGWSFQRYPTWPHIWPSNMRSNRVFNLRIWVCMIWSSEVSLKRASKI